MKKSLKIFGSLFALLFLFSLTATAGAVSDKFMNKARTAIENASPDDWSIRANWAKKCIDRGINTQEVSNWLDKSLEIQENAYNLEVKGDYYVKNNMPKKALELYLKSMNAKVKGNDNYNITDVQEKIAQLK